ncbi:hypothetical protein AAC387_Pa01g3008 [Persea americana]
MRCFFTRKFNFSKPGYSAALSSSSSSSNSSRIRAFVQQGLYHEALLLFSSSRRRRLNCSDDKFTFPSLLKASAALSHLNHGKTIHASTIHLDLLSDPFILSALINMYSKCGSLHDAIQVFDRMPQRDISLKDVAVWNAMIDAYFLHSWVDHGIHLFLHMQSFFGVRPDGHSLSIMLGGACVHRPTRGLDLGKQIHGYVIRTSLVHDPFIGTLLIEMYAKCKRPFDACLVFDELGERNAFAWNALLGGLGLNGLWERSLELFVLMKNDGHETGMVTLSSALTACAIGGAFCFGRQVHGGVIKAGFNHSPYVCTSLLTMYAKCMSLKDSWKVFEETSNKETELCNAMISAYIGNGNVDKALHVYTQMRSSELRYDSFTISNVLSACSMDGLYDCGRRVHGEAIKSPAQCNIAVQSALLTMYARCGGIDEASSIFYAMKERDVVAWSSMIAGLCQNRKPTVALELLGEMLAEGLELDSTALVSIINACTGLENEKLGFQIHGLAIKSGFESDIFVGCALVDMYAKCKLLELAERVFSSMNCKNLVTWNSIISGCCRNGQPDRAISLFAQISQHGLTPDSISITSVLIAIASLAALLKGMVIHGFLIRNEIQSDPHVDNALIDMYIKCGCLLYAQRIFDRTSHRKLAAWNSMIAGYGSHGHCLEAIGLFNKMQNTGVLPDDVTFLALISSCSHSGLVKEGISLFQSMSRDYGIVPRMEHYTNMVDLWGRAGHLDEAFSFIQSMPIEPDASVWMCLLCACRAYRQIELGEIAADQLLKIDPERSGNYVQLLNLYGEARLWDKAAELRMLMKERGIKKSPGCSWIEVRDKVDLFFSGDSSSPRTVEIHATLKSLRRIMVNNEVSLEVVIS